MESMGKRIRAFRLKRNLTQERLAELLHVTAQAVSKWEHDINSPDIATLPELSAVLGVTLDELFDTDGGTHLRRIERMLENGTALSEADFRYAEGQLTEGLSSAALKPRCLTLLAELYLDRAEHYKRLAADRAKQALALEPEEKANHSLLCQAMDGALPDWCCTNHTALIDYYKTFTENHPDYAAGYLWYLDNLIADGRLEEARSVLERMRAVRDDYHYELYKGRIAEQAGDRTEAERLWNEMVAKYPQVWFAWSSRADAYARRADYEKALADYREAIARQSPPRYTDNYDSIAQICVLTGDTTGAADAYDHVLDILRRDWGITEGETVSDYQKKISALRDTIR